MKYEELVERVREGVKKAKISKLVGHVAFQFNVKGEAEGAFYLEIDNGRINVEPYEYYDRDMIIVSTADIILQMLEGQLKPRLAYTKGLLEVYGNVDLLDLLPFGGR